MIRHETGPSTCRGTGRLSGSAPICKCRCIYVCIYIYVYLSISLSLALSLSLSLPLSLSLYIYIYIHISAPPAGASARPGPPRAPEHYPRDTDPEIRGKKATGDNVFNVCLLFSKRNGLWVWVSFTVLSTFAARSASSGVGSRRSSRKSAWRCGVARSYIKYIILTRSILYNIINIIFIQCYISSCIILYIT